MSENERTHPWDQLPDESGPAYRAFRAYCELGPTRSIDEVARQLGGHQERTKRAPGRLKTWSVDHHWSARARAWDAHQASVRQKAVEEAERASAERWVRRRDELLEKEFEAGKRLLDQANLLALFPVLEQTKEADGKTTVLNAVPPTTLRAAAVIAREGAELARAAIDRALDLQQEKREQTGKATLPPQSEIQAEATRRVEAHRAAMRAKILQMPTMPPGKPLDPPSELEQPSERNGTD